jgi:hypothetical protein
MLYAYSNFLNKGNNPFRMQVLNCFGYLSIFVDACENFVMADDVATPLNPLVALVEKEELKKAPLDETSLDVNVSQRLREKEPSKRLVRIQVDRSAWDRQLSSNAHALTIYLEFFLAQGTALGKFEEHQCEDDNVGFLVMAIIVSYEAQSTPFSM